ncbi:type II secretion system protein GspD [Verrucomicrobiota bacterium]
MRAIVFSSLVLLITVSICFSQPAAEKNTQQNNFLTRRYDVYPWVMDEITKPEECKSIFGALGVPWPKGSSIIHVFSQGKLVVVNTRANLSVFEEILEELNKIPPQIGVEIRFIEVRGARADMLETEWMLTGNWKKNEGKNWEDESQISSGPTTIAGVLTKQELAMIIHSLKNNAQADLLSAPKIITMAGTRGTVKVVTSYTYPTKATVESVTVTNKVNGVDTEESGTLVVPGGFETRDSGISLSVLPTVNDEQMINLNLKSEVVDEPTWKDYGVAYIAADGAEKKLSLPQPFFSVRGINTTIAVHDNATVILGGMITEKKIQVEKRTPVLGRIPFIGRAFRRTRECTEKCNLLIFVTAHIIDATDKVAKP